MQRTIIFFLFLFCLNITYSQSINTIATEANGKQKLLGKINKEGLSQAPFKEWFDKNYDSYEVNKALAKSLKKPLKDYEIKVFLGTWCGDSKREVPRFYKALEAAGFSEEQLEVIAVDRTKEAYKQSPTGEEKGLNIHRVPTFIFFKDGKEVNRIVEHPTSTFERDIESIIKGDYRPNYMAANYLGAIIEAEGVEKVKEKTEYLISVLSELVKGTKELNTLGLLNLRAGKFEEAICVFELNTKIFPYKSRTFNSLADAYSQSENYEMALKNYGKTLELDPKNKTALNNIERIKKMIE